MSTMALSDLFSTIESGSAVFSDCSRYRYLLTREWNSGSGTCLFIMLNPSTADAARDDPTIRRCTNFSRAWGYRRLEVVNLFAGRATTPAALFRMNDPCGPENDAHIISAAARADATVVAWGNSGAMTGRDRAVLRLLHESSRPVLSLGVNRTGLPRHPLYAPGSARAKSFR